MKKQDDALKYQLKLLEKKLAVLYGIGLVALSCLSLFSNYVLKNQAAEQATSLIRRTVARGDYRETIYTLNDAKLDYFEAVVYFKEDGARLFSLPAQLDPDFINQKSFGSQLLYSKIRIDLNFGEGGSKIGTVLFVFNRLSHLPFAVLIWLFFVLGTIPIMRQARNRVIKNYREQIELQNEKSRADLARRVRHDIRSPLGALLVATRNMTGLDSRQANLVRRATERIGEIVSELELIRAPSEFSAAVAGKDAKAILSILQSIVQEKRIQLPESSKINIKLAFPENAFSFFATINSAEMKRAISNIIDNSIDAISKSGHIAINLAADAQKIQLTVSDDGCGMEEEVLSRALEMGFTSKNHGSGLGLYYAKSTVEGAGGTLLLESKLGAGTKVTITLPRSQPPAWYTDLIQIPEGGTVAILDDQESSHLSWKMRLDDFRDEGHSFKVQHFRSEEEFTRWYRENRELKSVLFLFDYDLGNGKPTGIDVLENHEIKKNVLLVTGNFDSEEIQQLCSDKNIGLVAKSSLSQIQLKAI